jgi:hypothetical protein
MVPLTWLNLLGRPASEIQPRERLFLEVGVGRFPVQRTAASDTAFSERDYRAIGATTLDRSSAARARISAGMTAITCSRATPAFTVRMTITPVVVGEEV